MCQRNLDVVKVLSKHITIKKLQQNFIKMQYSSSDDSVQEQSPKKPAILPKRASLEAISNERITDMYYLNEMSKTKLNKENEKLKPPHNECQVERAKKLFDRVVDTEEIQSTDFSSILISSFGLRNYDSLCGAISDLKQAEEERQQRVAEEEARRRKILAEDQTLRDEEQGGEDSDFLSELSFNTTAATSTDTGPSVRRRLAYLLGLEVGGEEEGYEFDEDLMVAADAEMEFADLDDSLSGVTETMKQAQKYLRTHKIFEFFQFIIVHLLSKSSDDPIQFILHTLDKVLMYRTGMSNPPVHYKRKHLEQLFLLMDPMRTGFIDFDQYKTGLKTIGIKCYNKEPPRNEAGLISKSTFIEEAYECQCCILNTMIRIRKQVVIPRHLPGPPPPGSKHSLLYHRHCTHY